MTEWLLDELERITRRARAETDAHQASDRLVEVRARVAEYLRDHPDATANAVWRAIGGRRGEVLLAVRQARVPVPVTPEAASLGAAELGIRHDRQRFLLALKQTLGCKDCGATERRLDFDHRDGEVKLFDIASSERRSWEELLAEIAKCDVRCSSCHTARHQGAA